MPSFVCDACQETLKKAKLESHAARCTNAVFSCIDCSTTFSGNSYKQHTSCISEAEKYQKHLYKPKKGASTEPKEKAAGATATGSPSVVKGKVAEEVKVEKKGKRPAEEEAEGKSKKQGKIDEKAKMEVKKEANEKVKEKILGSKTQKKEADGKSNQKTEAMQQGKKSSDTPANEEKTRVSAAREQGKKLEDQKPKDKKATQPAKPTQPVAGVKAQPSFPSKEAIDCCSIISANQRSKVHFENCVFIKQN
jgi:cell growth-regulating nucleolar protein